MDDGGEIDLKFALEVHGIHGRASSESESDHSSDFDEYEEYKPPPVEINADNVIIIYPSDEENKFDTNIREGSPNLKNPAQQPIQNVINTAAIRRDSLNPLTIQNDMNGNIPGTRPVFPNPNNIQHFQQPIQNYYNPHTLRTVPVFPNYNNMQQFHQNVYNVHYPNIRIRPDFPNFNNIQQFQQPIQNYYNPHAIRVIPVFPNPNNMQQFPQTVQNDSNPNAEGIRPAFPNPSNMQQPQIVKNDFNPNAERIRPYFPNPSNMQQPQTVQNNSNLNAERIRADSPNLSNMQQPQTVQINSNLNAEFPNLSNMQQPQNVQNYSYANAVKIRPEFSNPCRMQQPQTVQNNSNLNAERIRADSPNLSNMQQLQTVQNDSNPDTEKIRPESPNPSNMQQLQNVQNYSYANAVKIRPEFSNPCRMQQPQTVQNYSNPNSERIIPYFLNPSNMQHPQTVQNDSNPNTEKIRPESPNPSNMQQPQNVQNYSYANAVKIRPEFSNPCRMQQPQTVQNYSNPNSERIIPYFPNPSNMQHPQTLQNDSNPNAARIRPYFINPNSMQHFQNHNNLNAANFPRPTSVPQFYQTNQNFNTGTVPIINNFLPNVTGMGYNPYQLNRPLSPMPGLPYGQPYPNYPQNQYWQHPNQFQGYNNLIKNAPPNETKDNYFPKSIHLSSKAVDIMNIFREEDCRAVSKSKEEKTEICNAGDIFDNNSKIVVSVEELVRPFVVGNIFNKSMNVSVIKRFKIDCIQSEIISKVREQFNIVISELEINPESIVYLELSSKINELLCGYHKECLSSNGDTENAEHDINVSDDQSRDDEFEPTAITVSESSINFQQKSTTTVVQARQIEGSYSQKFVSTTIKSVDGLRKSTGTIPKNKIAKKARKLSKKGKTKKLHIVEKPENSEEFTRIDETQKLLISVEEAMVESGTDISKENYEEICEEYVYEDIYGWNQHLDRSLLTEQQSSTHYTDSNNHESNSLLDNVRERIKNIHLSTASIKSENKRNPKNQGSRWTYLKYPIMGCLISGLTRSMLSWIVNNSIQICTFCFLWILKK